MGKADFCTVDGAAAGGFDDCEEGREGGVQDDLVRYGLKSVREEKVADEGARVVLVEPPSWREVSRGMGHAGTVGVGDRDGGEVDRCGNWDGHW